MNLNLNKPEPPESQVALAYIFVSYGAAGYTCPSEAALLP